MSDKGAVTSAENDMATTPTKKGRTSNVTRATAEGEALLKVMGFEDKETPGRRRTRAAIRGDVYSPPSKKEKKASTPGTGRRGRPPKKSEEGEKKEESVDDASEKEKDKKKDKSEEDIDKESDEETDEKEKAE